MFTERILETTENPVVLAEQKLSVPTERLVRALGVAETLGLSLVNLTYLGAPFVDPGRGGFDLLKPRVLIDNGMRRPRLSKLRSGEVGQLSTEGGESLASFYRDMAKLRATDFRLGLGQVRWLMDPQEFDMTEFYLASSGLDKPTRESIMDKYLPAYWRELGESGVPVITDFAGLSNSCRRMIEQLRVRTIDLEDFNPDLGCSAPKIFSQASYVDLSMVADPVILDTLLYGGLQDE